MKKINIINICLLAFLFNSCEKAADEPTTVLPAIYQGCCGTKPVEFTFGLSKVYIPPQWQLVVRLCKVLSMLELLLGLII
jgi:hypothetical protein